MAHNYYQQFGGEDASFEAEAGLLENYGHNVIRYIRDNHEIEHYSLFQKIQSPFNTIWSSKSYRNIEEIINIEKPEIAHFQNTFPLISPSIFYACKRNNIPIVWSVRNYRLFCLNGLLLRSERICEICINKYFAWPGIFHACYRKSHPQSAVVASMLTFHKLLKTWSGLIDRFICLSEFSRNKLIEGGIPAHKLIVKPNFINDPGESNEIKSYALFVGRLSNEKGIQTILKSIENYPTISLVIVGSGPLESEVKEICSRANNVKYLGHLGMDQVLNVVKKAKYLVYPSLVYETFGRGIIEAYACGIPVIASKIGAIAELVENNRTGIFFNSGDPTDLGHKMMWMEEHPEDCERMGLNARKEYVEKFTAERNYQLLIDIYSSLLPRKNE